MSENLKEIRKTMKEILTKLYKKQGKIEAIPYHKRTVEQHNEINDLGFRIVELEGKIADINAKLRDKQ